MKRRTFSLGAFAISLFLLHPSDATARPGGGSSFGGSRSSGGSSRSSSSSSGSRSSSSSSWGGSRSSSSSSSGSRSSSSGSSGSYHAPEHVPVWAVRDKPSPLLRTAASPGISIYDKPAPHAPIAVASDQRSSGEKVFMGVAGAGLFAFIAAIVSVPIAIFGAIVKSLRKAKGMDAGWSSTQGSGGGGFSMPNIEAPGEVRRRMEQIRATDLDFSILILEDFLAALYTEAHAARGTGALERYSPYLRPAARGVLAPLPRVPVSTIIVGALRPVSFSRDDRARMHRVVYEIEANYTEAPPGGNPQSYYAAERWTLARAMGARSRTPGRARALVCPNCGAPLDRTVHGRCTYCSQAVDSGQFDWVVESIEIGTRETRGPMLTGTTEEVGTASPTVFDPAISMQMAALEKADPSLGIEHATERVKAIFSAMQDAWSSLEWKRARPFLTDRLWNAQTYWIEAYRQQGLRNVTENARITNLEIVRGSVDKWYLGLTVRIHATGLDYTKRASDGAVVGGSRTKERPYTEYWTIVRSASKPAPGQAPGCPSCGAPIANQMAERCGHCGALVESSTFDWVLSRIEQDEVYGG